MGADKTVVVKQGASEHEICQLVFDALGEQPTHSVECAGCVDCLQAAVRVSFFIILVLTASAFSNT